MEKLNSELLNFEMYKILSDEKIKLKTKSFETILKDTFNFIKNI